ncbi:hypothetical protein Pcar_0633 [Syntrophotalea carbinolica DSM 2380]|uniref:Uncharacterized protein n=1 Tax=Syntrophotalea carbinolica (strain DSM 2380 / NBRC 103641 / GraBd1) TaxID=338963 RepID=Q3A6W5_SYNC1|nr:hypothetical protein [Syntrophotalea carbinolica]ABA87892.1 hypothetical protein Pcar_0633 [Syntrophotalea carbinolica DSM 2380]
MKPDFALKKTKLEQKIAGFAGYDSHRCAQADWQLRKHLADALEKVSDRLADIMVNRPEHDPLAENFGYSLKTLAYVKTELSPTDIEEKKTKGLSRQDEERILDADLILLDKVAGLHTPLDSLEGTDSPERAKEALNLFDEGLAEVDDLFQLRCRLYRDKTRS